MFELITDDRPCGHCGYNLKGLPTSGACPECGAPIQARGRSRRFTDNLADAPRFYLRTLAAGLCLMAAGALAMGPLFLMCARTLRLDYAIALCAAAGIWWVGVVIATTRRRLGENSVRDAVLDSAWPAWSARVAQLLWPAVGVAWVLASRLTGPPGQHATLAALGLALAAIAGLAPLTLFLASLADWAGDSSLADRFRLSLSVTILCGLLMVLALLLGLFSGTVLQSVVLAAGFAGLLLLLAQGVFLWGLFQLAGLASWAVRNAATAAETGRRSREREHERLEEMGARTSTAAMLREQAPPPAGRPDALPPVGSAFGGATLPASDSDPYPLEPEPPARA